jgi:hypothetical protein
MPTTQTITRSLVELKTLDKRIKRLIDAGTFTEFKTKSHNAGLDETVFGRSAQSEYDSFMGLLARRDLVNYLVIESNNITRVVIDGREMAVSMAVDHKTAYIEAKERLLGVLKKQRQVVTIEKAAHEEHLKAKIDANIRAICGTKGVAVDSRTPDKAVVDTVTEGLTALDPFEVLDPLNLGDIIKSLEGEIETFKKNVDQILADSNAKTMITIPDKWYAT